MPTQHQVSHQSHSHKKSPETPKSPNSEFVYHLHHHHNSAPAHSAEPLISKPQNPGTPEGSPVMTLSFSGRRRNRQLARGFGEGKILFVDGYTSGISGDMFLAAMIDLGVPPEALIQGLESLHLQGYFCDVQETQKSAIVAPRYCTEFNHTYIFFF